MIRWKLTTVLVILLSGAHPLRAETVLLQETFEGSQGKSVDGWNGWTGYAGVVISKTVIDRGNSAGWTGDGQWPKVNKTFSHAPNKGETYVLTATLNAFDANGSYAEMRLASGKTANFVGVALGYRDLQFEQNAPREGPHVQVPQTAETMDVRLVVCDEKIGCYYRNHGEEAWTLGGTLKALSPLSAYNTIIMIGGNMPGRSGGGGIDSIRLTATSAEPQQEPNPPPK